MSWRTVAALLVGVFVIVLIQAVLADPLIEVTETIISGTTTSSDHFDGAQLIRGWVDNWFWMGTVAIVGLLAWAVARVMRRELTRSRL